MILANWCFASFEFDIQAQEVIERSTYRYDKVYD
jgi:hypothetical protein